MTALYHLGLLLGSYGLVLVAWPFVLMLTFLPEPHAPELR